VFWSHELVGFEGSMENFLTISNFALLAGGVFAFWKWWDQRNRELSERRFEQYWKLVDVSQESSKLAKQKVALLLMKKFPEFKEETIAFLGSAVILRGTWVDQNTDTIDEVLDYLKRKD
jgi:hypothetical protein